MRESYEALIGRVVRTVQTELGSYNLPKQSRAAITYFFELCARSCEALRGSNYRKLLHKFSEVSLYFNHDDH